jgi:hypothetical protein
LRTERYHLFPQLGLVVLIVLVARRWLSGLDRRPPAGLGVATGLAVLLLGTHLGYFEDRARTYRFPEQRATLAALERLGALCRPRNVTRNECIAALEPVWTPWFQPEFNGLWMVPAPTRVPVGADPRAPQFLLEALTATERQALWGGMDVSRYLGAAEDLAGASPRCVAVGRLIETDHVHCGQRLLAMGMRPYTATGRAAYLEFELLPPDLSAAAGLGDPRFLGLPCGPSRKPPEIWWARRGEAWSAARCVRLRPDPKQPPREWAFPLTRFPHWDPADAGRIRVRIRFAGAEIAIGEPRLLR